MEILIMKGRLLKGLLAVVGLSLCGLLMGTAASNDTAPPPPGKTTFYKDVLPILQNNCQSCHRAGEVAPMALMTYEDARPWAVGIKMAVTTGKMPPWYADPQYGHFSNERKLTRQEIRTLVSWVDGGAKPGDAKDAPAPVQFVDGWNIGTPDRVIEMPAAYNVPAEGTVEYQYMVIPGGFTQDTWVRAAEVRPGNRAVVHHVIAFIRPPGSKWMADAKPGEFFLPKKEKEEDKDKPEAKQEDKQAGSNQHPRRRRSGDIGELRAGYAPGLQRLRLTDEAKLIKAGSDIILQLHYTPTATPATAKTTIPPTYAKQPSKLRNLMLAASNAGFKIPPNDGNYEVKSQVELQ